jgi:hypothetical protein
MVTVGIVETYEALRRRVKAMSTRDRHVSRAWAGAGVLLVAVGAASLVPWRVTAQAPQAAQSAGEGGAHGESHARLARLATAMMMYSQDYDEVLPPMHDAAEVKQHLVAYLQGNDQVFVQPETNEAFQPNPALSGKRRMTMTLRPPEGPAVTRRSEIAWPGQTVAMYEARPATDDTRGVLLIDGRIARVPEAAWPQLRRATGLEGAAAAHPLGFSSVDELFLLPFPDVQTDLGLTPSQKAAVEAAGRDIERADREARQPRSPEGDAAVAEQHQAVYRLVYESLSPQQQTRLYQFVLQVNGAASLLRDPVQQELELTPEQRGAILALLLEHHDAERVLVDPIETPGTASPDQNAALKRLPELRRETYEKALGVLTRSQRERWQRRIGPPAELKALIAKA